MIEQSPNINYLRANLIIEEFTRLGAGPFVISPGSRNSPLVMAAAANPLAKTVIHYDERGAAFYALGYGKAQRKPVVLICTSGTATANYYPAVVEAYMSGTPLIILTADRPAKLRNTGEFQTIDQRELYGRYVRGFIDMEIEIADLNAIAILTSVDEMYYRSMGTPNGPVHINCQFDEPLHPVWDGYVNGDLLAEIDGWLSGSAPFTTQPDISIDQASLADCRDILERAKRPLIAIGYRDWGNEHSEAIDRLCGYGIPVLADIGSGLQLFDDSAGSRIINYDLILRNEKAITKLKPDIVIHIGGLMVSKSLNVFMQSPGVEVIRITERDDLNLHPKLRGKIVRSTITDTVNVISQHIKPVDEGYLELWRELDGIVDDKLRVYHESADIENEATIARTLLSDIPDESALFLGNSMPVRDAGISGVRRNSGIVVCINRGAAGIDGNIATAVGFAEGLNRPTAALIGDLTLFHDLNSLKLASESSVPIVIVVINNGGGGIFSFLPIAEDNPNFEKYFAASHSLFFGKVSEMFGLEYESPSTLKDFRTTLKRVFESDSRILIELKTDRNANYQSRNNLFRQISQALDSAIAQHE